MKNKNTVIALLIVFIGICAYNLYWTYVQFSYEGQMKSLEARADADTTAKKELEARLQDNDFQETYQKAIDNSFTLGLDLQGGMFVTLEVGVDDVVRQLAGNNASDTSFMNALNCANERQQTEQANFVPLFIDCFGELAPNSSLGAIFASPERQISISTSDEEVRAMLDREALSAVERTFNIIRTRIDQFGVASPNMQLQEGTGRILLELPGVKEPERVRQLLRSTAKLEFWTSHNRIDGYRVLYQVNERLKVLRGIVDEDSVQSDTSLVESIETDSTLLADAGTDTTEVDTGGFTSFTEEDTEEGLADLSDEELDQQIEEFKKKNPLFGILRSFDPSQIRPDDTYPVVGQALETDTAEINRLLNDGEISVLIPDDMRFSWSYKAREGEDRVFDLIALKSLVLGGDVVTDARQDFDQQGQAEVSMGMNVEGAKDWATITENNVNRHVAIVLDGLVYSFPIINQRIGGGQSSIAGNFTIDEAKDLANVLKAGQLPVPARIEGEDVVGPTLGEENIRSGWRSFILAFIVTLIFMALYYARAGFVANLALIANLVFILGCSAAFTIVLTVPGIAAVVLTVGMAVDANVLIFERIREEMAKGKTLKASIKSGFSNAFSSVMDANITTFLTGVVLYAFGIGPIRGFAVSLMIGIITSLISALIITRLILDYYANKGKNSISFGYPFTTGLFDKIRLNMVKRRKTFYAISLGLIVLFSLSFIGLGFKTGVDFQGGRQFVVEFLQNGQPADLTGGDVEQIRKDLTSSFESDAPIIKTMSSNNQLMITSSYKVEDREATQEVQDILIDGLNKNYDQYTKNVISSTDVGPTVASDIRQAAFLAVLFSLIIIFFYILLRFRKWQYSLGAIIAIFHDVIIVLGIFSVLGQLDLPFSVEINQALIAALLTIIGYSINDTVVVFDRIRENLGEMKSTSLPDVYNVSIDQTISRTLITSVTTLITALILFFAGGDVIKGFTFAIIIGIMVGTYSSIFVASPISLDLLSRQAKAQS
ncbi:MAG: protein translocase subunit SecDF [Bacteroidota bacterium]